MFHILLRHSLILKWIYTQYPNIMIKQKQFFRNICKYIYFFKHWIYDICISIQTYWEFSLIGTDTTSLAPVFGEFLPFFSADPLKLCQIGWGVSLYSYFQVSPEMFDRVEVRALAGPLEDIQRLVPKPLLRCLGCVLRDVKPSPQSEVLSALEQVFIKDLSVLCSVHLCLNPDYSPSSCRWKNTPTAWCCHHHASH